MEQLRLRARERHAFLFLRFIEFHSLVDFHFGLSRRPPPPRLLNVVVWTTATPPPRKRFDRGGARREPSLWWDRRRRKRTGFFRGFVQVFFCSRSPSSQTSNVKVKVLFFFCRFRDHFFAGGPGTKDKKFRLYALSKMNVFGLWRSSFCFLHDKFEKELVFGGAKFHHNKKGVSRDDGTIFSIQLWTEGDDDFPTRTRPRAQNSNVRQTNANDGQN